MKRWLNVVLLAALGIAAPTEAKRVKITSEPEGAKIFVDGREIGETPMETTKSALMPNWLNDGRITNAVVTIELPMYKSESVTVSEFRVPKNIAVTLERDAGAEQFENYLSSVPELVEKTVAAAHPAALYASEDLDADAQKLASQGYVLVAYVGTKAAVVPLDLVRERAKAVGAAIILMQSRDDGVQTELRTVTTHTSGGVSTGFSSGTASGSAFVSGPGGSASAFGSASYSGSTFAMMPGHSTTSVVPFATRQFATQATLWRKRKATAIGAITEVLPPELRSALQRNTGALVLAVEEDSPAFLADVLAGDVIVGASGRPVRRPQDLADIVTATGSGSITLDILRGDKPVQVTASLTP